MVGALSAKGCTSTPNAQGVSNYGMIWLDIEGPGTYWGSSTSNNQAFFNGLLSSCLGYANCGVYTSASQWNPIMGSSYTGGASRPLWYAHYDDVASFSDFAPFGGWTSPAIKQYEGDVAVCSADIDQDWYP